MQKTGWLRLCYLIDIIVVCLSLVSAWYTAYFVNNEGYVFICLLPLAYLAVYQLVFRRMIYKELRIFLTVFTGVSFVRYVLMPALIVLAGLYGGRSAITPSTGSFQKATFLMVYELIFLGVVIQLLETRKAAKERKHSFLLEFEFPQHTFTYTAFFFLTLLFSLLMPSSYNLFSFIKPRLSGAQHLTSPGFIQAVILYMLFTSKHLLFALGMTFCYKRHQRTGKQGYQNLAFLILILNISIFYGLNRSDLVMPALASLLIYSLLFRDKNIVKYILTAGLIFVLVNTIAASRELASFSKNTSQLIDTADFVQGYFGGIYNVAIAIETYDYFPQVRSLPRLLYDTFRPFIGFNVLLKNVNVIFTNAFFNRRLWFSNASSQIIPMIGQGYLHFGYIFAPILDSLVLGLAWYLENRLSRIRRIELVYFYGICLIRMAFLMGQNTSNISNELSMNLVMFTIIYHVNNRISFNPKGGAHGS